ncbi:hypothetical protein DB346_01960 [Verrucomicrobia bacterium LW23]|nr:hypothetical protein DB346_01960 [Verrucomicrobia bacterium LW23]
MASFFSPFTLLRGAALAAAAALVTLAPLDTHAQSSINSKRTSNGAPGGGNGNVTATARSRDPVRTQNWPFSWSADESRRVDRIVISLSAQRVYAYQGGRIVLDTPCSTGRPGHSTPVGTWRIFFKNANHFSGSYGAVVNARGQVVNADATPRSYVPRGCAYLRAPMPYFMKFVGGIGLHTGMLPGYPASHGCIRLPNEAARRLFALAPIGTPVSVVRAAPAGTPAAAAASAPAAPST